MNVLQSIEEGRFQSKKEYLSLDDVLSLMKDKSVLIGSRAWDVHLEDSDYDYVCSYDDFINIYSNREISRLSTVSNGLSSNNEGFILNNDFNVKIYLQSGEILNLIVYKDISKINLFNKVNDRILLELSKRDLRNREKRHRYFELLCKEEGIHDNLIINYNVDDIPF